MLAWVVLISVAEVPALTVRVSSGNGAGTNSSIARADHWTPCAMEGEVVRPQGLVRFGWGGAWAEATLPAGSTCAASTFGGTDPLPNVRKLCECASSPPLPKAATTLVGAPPPREELGETWSYCAAEGGICTCDSGAVRFGASGRWAFSTLAERGRDKGPTPLTCAAESFGEDPAEDVAKTCWCLRGEGEGEGGGEVGGGSGRQVARGRVAVVMLSRHPPDLGAWLRYHLGYMEVDHLFLQVEDTPELAEGSTFWLALPADYQQRVTVWRVLPPAALVTTDARPTDDYDTLQARQMQAMRRAMESSRSLGMDWLIHIDDDELLHAPRHRPIGELLAAVGDNYDQVYIPNVEAVYESAAVKNCFAETTRLNMNRYKFASYANGKAAARVTAPTEDRGIGGDLQPWGPHQWRLSSGDQPLSMHMEAESFGPPLMVVHFESCPFSRWADKFFELGHTSSAKIDKIPFPFYRESIRTMQRCETGGASSWLQNTTHFLATAECSEAKLERLWSSWKTVANSNLAKEDLMPLHIPWGRILAGSLGS